MILLERARKIIAAMYQQDEEENGGKKIWKPENISASDLEKVICSGIPINKMGNLKKMSASILAKHFSQKILARCGMGEIYIVNPYECFILMCLLTDCPLAVFSEIWEKSYEEGEEKN